LKRVSNYFRLISHFMKFKYLIVDDEPLARKLMATHAAQVEILEPAGQCANAMEASSLVRNQKIDLIFLDIEMPELSGLDFIKTFKNPPAIILVTAYRNFAPEAFELDVLDYLLKPVSFERFLKSVNKFLDKVSLPSSTGPSSTDIKDFIYLKANRKDHKIKLDDILYIESLDDYVKVILTQQTLITHENISTLEQKLPADKFVRIHRSFLISLRHISAVSSESVLVAGKELPFGRAFKKLAQHVIYNQQ
jgi:DNA-binding LytR/AlgR family response regulator